VLWSQRRAAITLLVLSFAPLIGWFAYESVSGASTGHSFAVHVTPNLVRALSRTMANWIFPANAPTAVAAVGALLVVGAVVYLVRHTSQDVTKILVLFAVIQVGVLVVANTFVDAGVNLEPRQVIYVFVALVMAAACSLPDTGSVKIATWIVVALFLVRGGLGIATNPGGGYSPTPQVSSATWHDSPIIAAVRGLPASKIIYTNAPDALYLLDNRATSSVPELVDFSTVKKNPEFSSQIAEIRHTLLTRGGYVVYLRGFPRGNFLPSEATLRRLLSLQVVRNVRDGAIYRISDPT